MAEKGESPDELGRRIAALYRELSYPSEAKFRVALRKRGIRVSAEFVKEVVADQSSRQLIAPPPRFTGHVTARKVDHRWMVDLMDYTAKSTKSSPQYVFILQDVFSRFIFAVALRNKAEVTAAFSRLLEQTGRKPEELSSDKGSEFMSASFRTRLSNLGIAHRVKAGPQDLATLDRAIGTLRATLSRRTAESGAPWYEELDAAVDSLNNTAHSALFGEEPASVETNDDLRFDLRYHNAEMAAENQEQAEKRGERLTKTGAFRVLLRPTTGFRRRAGGQNWSEKIRGVARIEGGRVVDEEGDSFPMSIVKPVSETTRPVAPSSFAQGGSSKVAERRRVALSPWRQDIIDAIRRAGTDGLTVAGLSRIMADKQGFAKTLKEQRATLAQAVRLFPEIKVESRSNQTFLTVDAAFGESKKRGPLDAFAA